MNYRAISTLTLFTFAGISSAIGQSAKRNPTPISKPPSGLVILGEADWVDVFNGKDLSGWNGDTQKYVARDGMIVCEKGAKYLRTDKQYGDFAFSFEFKLEESGNNGIGIRIPEGGHPSREGMEIQILDHNGSKYNGIAEIAGKKRKLSWLKPWQYHGSSTRCTRPRRATSNLRANGTKKPSSPSKTTSW